MMKILLILGMIGAAMYITQMINDWEAKYKRKQDKLREDGDK